MKKKKKTKKKGGVRRIIGKTVVEVATRGTTSSSSSKMSLLCRRILNWDETAYESLVIFFSFIYSLIENKNIDSPLIKRIINYAKKKTTKISNETKQKALYFFLV